MGYGMDKSLDNGCVTNCFQEHVLFAKAPTVNGKFWARQVKTPIMNKFFTNFDFRLSKTACRPGETGLCLFIDNIEQMRNIKLPQLNTLVKTARVIKNPLVTTSVSMQTTDTAWLFLFAALHIATETIVTMEKV
ncbi:hypothetical protein T07_7620 [Trichinella nelsoni]|uniref:Uncharacterized protein n=1 Tax=Trichinella nelsoni TaxID=6336 RepID=A0A0V0RJY9_9BILA|nr:hypothetical protein T07_7620 [Trichinella nelsoni]